MADKQPGKRPAFQYYPGDVKRDTALQSCSWEARSLWRDMMDSMHDGEPYGHFTAGGVPLGAAELSRSTGKSIKLVERWIAELELKKVFSRTADGVIYSRRMVRDEELRNERSRYGKLGGNPNLVGKSPPSENGGDGSGRDKPPVKPRVKPIPTPAVATATASAFASAEEPVSVSARAGIALCAAANRGLAEHEKRPQLIPRILPGAGGTTEALEAMTGVPLAFAESQIYALAKSHTADGEVVTLKYFSRFVLRRWQERAATADASNSTATVPAESESWEQRWLKEGA